MKIKLSVLFSLFVCLSFTLRAQVTGNYSCASAASLTSGTVYTENTASVNATGNPTTDCSGYGDLNHGVWFTITTPATQNVRLDLSTCNSSYYTEMLIYTNATCGSLNCPLMAIRGNNPFGCSGAQAGASFSAPSNTTYLIYVASVNGYNGGTLYLQANLSKPPANDTCANPIPLTSGVLVITNTFDATEFGDPTTDCIGNDDLTHGVWFTITTPPTQNVRLDLTTCNSSYYTEMLIYTNATCGSLDCPLMAIRGSNPFGCSGAQAGTSFSAPSNTTYLIYVASVHGYTGGTLYLQANLSRPPANDTRANPMPLTSGVLVITNTFDATEFGDPTSDCNGYNDLTHGVWFTVTTPPTQNVRLDLTTCNSSYYTEMLIYTNATSGSLDCPLMAVRGSNPFGCSGAQAGTSFSAPSNTTYLIYVASVNGYTGGTLYLQANLSTPPANDTCANPIPLTSGVLVVTNTFDATEFGDPVSDCYGHNDLTHGVWFTITTPPTQNVRLDLSTCNSSYYTEMLIYTNATCGSLDCPLMAIRGSNPFGCSGAQAGTSFSAPSNTTYLIYVASVNGYTGGTLYLQANLSTPPANDTCANPMPLTSGVLVITNTFDATEFGDPTSDCNGYNDLTHGVWFTITTPPTQNVRLDLSTCNSSYYTEMLIYTNAPCGSLDCPLMAIRGSNPFGCSGAQAGTSFSAPSNTTYLIYVASVNGYNGGTLYLQANLSTPPANDTCANPMPLNNGVLVTTNTFDATEFGDPTIDCNGNDDLTHGVWFAVNAFSQQQVTINTCGSSYYTELLIYTNAPCGVLDCPFLVVRGSNPFGCSSAQAAVSFNSPITTTYFVFVASVNGYNGGTLDIVANSPPPPNDTCSTAIPMTPGVTYATNTTYATSLGDPSPSCSPGLGRGIWYSYTPSANGLVGVTTCGSSFQTALAVYTGSCGSMTEIACSQSSGAYCNSGNADVTFNGVAGTTYYILAGGVNGQAGNLQIMLPIVDLAPASLTITNPAGGLVTAGRNFSTSWSVKNQGSNSINGSWIDQLILSNANTQVVLATFNGNHNATTNGGYPENFSGTLPQVQWGNYSLIALADASNSVAETTKTNNAQVISVTVTDIPPAITLFMPTNTLQLTSCVPLLFHLSAGVQAGSYSITNVSFFNGSTVIGQVTNAPYNTISLPLDHGTSTITAQVLDRFGLSAVSTNQAFVFINWPNQTNILRADAFSNTCVICMAALNGTNYVIEASSNLNTAAWQPLATNQVTGSLLVFTNQQTTPMRFYRTHY